MLAALQELLGIPTLKLYVRSNSSVSSTVFTIYVTRADSATDLVRKIGDRQEQKNSPFYGFNCQGIYAPDGFSLLGPNDNISEVFSGSGCGHSRSDPIFFSEQCLTVALLWVQAIQPNSEPYALIGLDPSSTTISQTLSAIRAHQAQTAFHVAYGRPVKDIVVTVRGTTTVLTSQFARVLSSIPTFLPNSEQNPLRYTTHTVPDTFEELLQHHVLGTIVGAANTVNTNTRHASFSRLPT